MKPLYLSILAPFAMIPLAAQSQTDSSANLAIVATPSTSYVSGHETLSAINDGFTPKTSGDHDHGAYGNWPTKGDNWLRYDWPVPVSINESAVYWFDDQQGIHLPATARLSYLDHNQWKPIPEVQSVGLEGGRFNINHFAPITTTAIKLEFTGRDGFSTGVLEWKILDSGASPDFPPLVSAGPDRSVVVGGDTYLTPSIKTTGKSDAAPVYTWEKTSGPGHVSFANPHTPHTTASFDQPGRYEITLKATADQLSSSDKLTVKVLPAMPTESLVPLETGPYSIDSKFWHDRIKNLIVNWIPHCVDECNDPDLKEGGMNNIISAGNKLAGKPYKPHVGYPFSNAWVLNTVESMCMAQMVDPQGDEQIIAAQKIMRQTLDEWIPLLLAAQEPDGYFQTRFTLGTHNEPRDATIPHWDARYRGEHEGYVAGYFIEAGIAHYLMTDGHDQRLYQAARRLADCWYDHIGPAPKQEWFDGHQEMEQALFRLARLVDQVEGPHQGDKYAELGRFLLDCRGRHTEGGSEYDQTHLPVTQQYSAVGHAVRAVYNYSAMTDVILESHDIDYESAVQSIWDNLVNRKYYVTGGIGSGETSEGFGADYSLPHNAYCESCSGVGMLLFQHKLNLASGQSRYASLYEDTLYNAILSDIDLEGQNFTYTNSLDSAEARYKWHVCPCCVGNIPRALLMLPSWTYAKDNDDLFVNLFVGGTTTVNDIAGTNIQIRQTTEYPWDGKVRLTITPGKSTRFGLHIRIPDHAVSELYRNTPEITGLKDLSLNGAQIPMFASNGYIVIRREWKAGDQVEFNIPLGIQRIHTSDKVAANRGQVALRYGPLVYNFESVDQNLDKTLSNEAPLQTVWKSDLLDGVMTIQGHFTDGTPLLAIPNYSRNNRGGRSVVWIKESRD